DYENDNYNKVLSHKKRKISEVDQMYFDELRSWEKEKFVKEQEFKFKLEMERMKKEFQYNLKVKELELKYKE
ncbi:2881_t:CDS:2, partial [Dentiscutata heterogama]